MSLETSDFRVAPRLFDRRFVTVAFTAPATVGRRTSRSRRALAHRRARRSGCRHLAGDGGREPGAFRSGSGGSPAYAGGGGSPKASGTTGSRARNISAISGGRFGRCARRWTAPAGCRTLAGAVAHLADDHRGPDGLFGPPVGGVYRRVPQEEEHGREFVGEMLGKALGVFHGRSADRAGPRVGRERVETVPGARVLAAVPHVQAGLEDGLHL